MKAKRSDLVRTTVDIRSDFGRGRVIPAGSDGAIVECYLEPAEGYAVDLAIPDASLVGGFDFENVVLTPDQFDVVGPDGESPGVDGPL